MNLFDDRSASSLYNSLQTIHNLNNQPQSAIQPLQPYEEDSVLSRLGQKVLPGVMWAGHAIDKAMGARGVRGAIGGNPSELLSILPFSDTLGITDPKNIVHGTDLLRKAGLVRGEDDDWQNVLAGIGTEIALNPVTYLTLGSSALTEAGQLASKLGVVPRTLMGRLQGISSLEPTAAAEAARLGINTADIFGKPLGGVAGFGLPFQHPMAVLGTGQGGQAIAKVAGGLKDAVAYSAPGRYLSAAFDPRVMGRTSAPVQKALREYGGYWDKIGTRIPGESAAGAAGGTGRNALADMLQELHPQGTLNDPWRFRALLEGWEQPITPAEGASVSRIRTLLDDIIPREQAAGLKITPYADRFGTRYAPRELGKMEREATHGFSSPALPTRYGATHARDPLWTDIPGGSGYVERNLVTNPALAGAGRTSANPTLDIFEEMYKPIANPTGATATYPTGAAELAQLRALPRTTMTPTQVARLDDLEFLWTKAGELDPRLAMMEPERVAGAGLWSRDPMGDIAQRFESGEKGIAMAETAHAVYTNPETLALAGKGGVTPMTLAVEAAGLEPKVALPNILKDLVTRHTPVYMAGTSTPTVLTNAATVADLGNVMVPAAVVKDFTGIGGNAVQGISETLKGPMNLFDSLTALLKGHLTAPWPAFHFRNLISSTYQSARTGANPLALMEAAPEISLLRSGKVIPGLSKRSAMFSGMTDAEATAEWARQAFAHRIYGRSQFGGHELTSLSPGGSTLTKSVPGMEAEPGLLDIAGNMFRGRTDAMGNSLDPLSVRWNPGNVAGVGGVGGVAKRNVDQFAPIVGGRQMTELVDDLTRGAMGLERVGSGYGFKAAADAATKAHFDYSMMSPTEKLVMRRLVPFYAWPRKNIELLADELSQTPGGLSAMGMRAATDVRDQMDKDIPPFQAGDVAIPIGGEGKMKTYLSKFDIPFEDPVAMFGGGIDKFGMRVGGLLNPLLKAPLEAMSGQDFHSGREHQGPSYGPTGSTLVDKVLTNSPASRYLSTVKTLADEKSYPVSGLLKLLTGIQLSDVDVERQKTSAAREVVDKILSGSPNVRSFEQFYAPPEILNMLSPAEIQALRLQKTLQARAQAAARERLK